MSEDLDRLRQVLRYDPETGKLFWINSWSRSGKEAGTRTKQGYIRVTVDGVRIMAHRICYALHYGRWPIDELDHKNRIGTDNRIENLRLVNHSRNMLNHPKVAYNDRGY